MRKVAYAQVSSPDLPVVCQTNEDRVRENGKSARIHPRIEADNKFDYSPSTAALNLFAASGATP